MVCLFVVLRTSWVCSHPGCIFSFCVIKSVLLVRYRHLQVRLKLSTLPRMFEIIHCRVSFPIHLYSQSSWFSGVSFSFRGIIATARPVPTGGHHYCSNHASASAKKTNAYLPFDACHGRRSTFRPAVSERRGGLLNPKSSKIGQFFVHNVLSLYIPKP